MGILSDATWAELDRLSQRVQKSERGRRPEPKYRDILVYVCPRCPHYYGTAGMGDLSSQETGIRDAHSGPLPPERRRSRADCGACMEREGKQVRMHLARVRVPVGG